MTISATTQGIKPGVCTSTNRPANPFDGMVIYETDTDKVAVYDSSAWVYKTGTTAPGLVYITQATPTAVNTVSINNCFTSSYANYLLVFDVTAAVGNGAFTARLRLSGTDATTNYATQRLGGQATTVFASANPTGTDDFYFASNEASTASGYGFSINILSPQLARTTVLVGSGGYPSASGTTFETIWANHTTATAYDGITVNYAGTSFTGTIRVYGYQNS
jgi:hypothetical protein